MGGLVARSALPLRGVTQPGCVASVTCSRSARRTSARRSIIGRRVQPVARRIPETRALLARHDHLRTSGSRTLRHYPWSRVRARRDFVDAFPRGHPPRDPVPPLDPGHYCVSLYSLTRARPRRGGVVGDPARAEPSAWSQSPRQHCGSRSSLPSHSAARTFRAAHPPRRSTSRSRRWMGPRRRSPGAPTPAR